MITDRFASLIEELSKTLHIQLPVDMHKGCIIRLKSGLVICIEPDRLGENIHICMDIGAPPPGIYRENILREALKANGLPPPRNGIFAFGANSNSLLLYDQISLENLTGPMLFDFIKILLQKARLWKSALERGEIPSFRATELTFGGFGAGRSKGMFGL